MISDSDESEDSDEDVKFDVDWVQRIVSSIRKRSFNLDVSLHNQKKNVNVGENVTGNSSPVTRCPCSTGTSTVPRVESWDTGMH